MIRWLGAGIGSKDHDQPNEFNHENTRYKQIKKDKFHLGFDETWLIEGFDCGKHIKSMWINFRIFRVCFVDEKDFYFFPIYISYRYWSVSDSSWYNH